MLTSSSLLLVLLSIPLVLPSLTGRTSGSAQFSLLNSALALQQPRCASRGTYGTAEIITALEQQHIRSYVPLPDFDQRTEFFGQRDFRYDREREHYICPNGARLHLLPSGCTDQFKQYRAKASVCNACPLKSQCTTSNTGRKLSRHVAEEAFERVRAFHQTAAYKKAMNKRKVWVEPLFAEAKDWHGMRRFRLRELWRVNIEARMKAAGQNLKRLLKKRGWGRRPFPAEAIYAFFLATYWWLTRPSLEEGSVFLLLGSDSCKCKRECIIPS